MTSVYRHLSAGRRYSDGRAPPGRLVMQSFSSPSLKGSNEITRHSHHHLLLLRHRLSS